MTPMFRIVADGADITALINDRLLLLRTSDKPGMESDEFELRIDDRDGQVALPQTPGLGVELDHAAVAELHDLYNKAMIADRDDTDEMLKYQPDYVRKVPRW